MVGDASGGAADEGAEALQAAEQCAPQDGGWGGCKAPGRCSGRKCRHDALVMWLLLTQDATDKGACWCGGGSLDLKCYCLKALMDEGFASIPQ
jgi:hypothetical protein